IPARYAVIVEPRRTSQEFPNILPERLSGLDENYAIQLGKQGRVAGRPVQQILIRPRDSFRYGYQLWADLDTGLLLKAELVDEKGRMLEQFVFAQVSIGNKVPAAALTSEMGRQGMLWHRDSSERGKDV